MKLIKITITSDTTMTSTTMINSFTKERTEIPARPAHRFYITRRFDDGSESTVYTNKSGEGLFATANDGSEYQVTGTAQFSVNDATATDAKRWFKGKLRRELAETGAALEFMLDY